MSGDRVFAKRCTASSNSALFSFACCSSPEASGDGLLEVFVVSNSLRLRRFESRRT
jgi:hypothetical protein